MSRKNSLYSQEQQEYKKTIGQRIKQLRKKYGFSQTDLVRKISISQQ